MDARALIQDLHSAGLALTVRGDALAVSPAGQLTELQRQYIKANKPAILAALAQKPAAFEKEPTALAGAQPQPPDDLDAGRDLAPEFGPPDPEPANEWQRRIWAGWQFHRGKWLPPGQWQPVEPHQGEPYPRMAPPETPRAPVAASEGHAPIPSEDSRRVCCQCLNLSGERCLAAARGEIIASRTYRPDPDRPRRCSGYRPSATDPDRRPGRERWPGLPDLPAIGTREGAA
jgi:hypothetical protein